MVDSPPPDRTVDAAETPVLEQHRNALKLALFGINLRGGATMADFDGKAQGTWEESLRWATRADRLGLDGVVPIARWRGYGGPANLGDRSFETFTWATGLLSATERIQVFATSHVPVAHPVFVAKIAATADHISGGRFGLNVVAGWFARELSMFGLDQRDHDDRYAVADEWAEVLKQLWTTPGDSSFHGKFFEVQDGYLEPKPLQRPHPVIMSAGTSPAGREFAAKHSDVIFAALTSRETAAAQVAEIKALARDRYNRELRVFGRAHVVCRDTEREAREAYEEIHVRQAEIEGARNVVAMSMANSQSTDWESATMQAIVQGMIAGFWAIPVIGTPDQVTEQLLDLHACGCDGIALSFPDYDRGLDDLEQDLLPRLIAAGVRAPISPPVGS